MPDKFLTDAIIKNKQDFMTSFPNIFIASKGKFKACSYVLIIRLITRIFTKFTIYPLNKNKILKITFIGFNIQDNYVEKSIKELKKYRIIHTSGLISLRDKSYYECYLELSIDDEDYKDLKILLDKIKNIFEDIKIVEILLLKNELKR